MYALHGTPNHQILPSDTRPIRVDFRLLSSLMDDINTCHLKVILNGRRNMGHNQRIRIRALSKKTSDANFQVAPQNFAVPCISWAPQLSRAPQKSAQP